MRIAAPSALRLAAAVSCLALLGLSGCRITPMAPAGPPAQLDHAAPSQHLARLWLKPGSFREVNLVSVDKDLLYVAGTPRGLEAVDVANGLTRWYHVGKYPVNRIPTVMEDAVYLDEGGQMVQLDRETGLETLRTRTKAGMLTPVYPSEHSWVAAAGDDRVYGLSPENGIRLWRVQVGGYVIGSDWDGATAFFVNNVGQVHAVHLATRALAWTHSLRKPSCSPPTVAGDRVLVGSEDYYLYCLNARNGIEEWRMVVSSPALKRPVVARDTAYVQTEDGVLHAIDMTGPKELWAIQNGGRVLTTSSARVIFVRPGIPDMIVVADRATGEILSEVTARQYGHYMADPEAGVFYAVSVQGAVLAIADRDVAATLRAEPKP